jgi:hypothetical protein
MASPSLARRAAVLAPLALSCGARTTLRAPAERADAGADARHDAPPDPPRDARTEPHVDASDEDAADPPSPATPRCELGASRVLERAEAPSFLLSLARASDGRYAYTTATSWGALERPRLIVRDASLERRTELSLDRLETIHAPYTDGSLYGITSALDPTRSRPPEHARYVEAPDGSLSRTIPRPLSMSGWPVDRPIARIAQRLAIPMTAPDRSGGLQLVELDTLQPGLAARSTELSAPAILATDAGWLAVSARPAGQLARVLFDSDGAGLSMLDPALSDLDASEPPIALRATDSAIAAVASRRAAANREITLALWSSERTLANGPERVVAIASTSPASTGLSASARPNRGWIAVAWGVQSDPRSSGAWLTVVDTSGRTLLPPTPAGELVRGPQSYAVFTGLAPHPEGFLLVWSGWQPSSQYAIHARVVRCR